MAAKKNTGKEYEKLVQDVMQEVLKAYGDETTNVDRDVILKGKSGANHQIDIYWEFEKAGILYRTCGSLKDWAKRIDQGNVLTFKAVLDDLTGQPRGFMVTKRGYQSGVLKIARHHGIKLYEVREPEESDLEGRVRSIHLTMHGFIPRATGIDFIVDEAWVKGELASRGRRELNISLSGFDNEILVYDNRGNMVGSVNDAVNSMYPKGFTELPPTYKEYTYEQPVFVQTGVEWFPLLKIKGVKVTISVSEHISQVDIDGDDMVKMIVKDIFEGSIILFDKDLKIKGGDIPPRT